MRRRRSRHCKLAAAGRRPHEWHASPARTWQCLWSPSRGLPPPPPAALTIASPRTCTFRRYIKRVVKDEDYVRQINNLGDAVESSIMQNYAIDIYQACAHAYPATVLATPPRPLEWREGARPGRLPCAGILLGRVCGPLERAAIREDALCLQVRRIAPSAPRPRFRCAMTRVSAAKRISEWLRG